MTNPPCVICGKTLSRPYGTHCRRCHPAWMVNYYQNSIDEMAVERLMMGNPPKVTTRGERQLAVQHMTTRKYPKAIIAARLHVSERTVTRLRARAM